MPYHDPAKPYVNFWFASADGGSLRRFLQNFTIEAMKGLEANGSLCIGYVHFAAGFVQDGKLNAEFRKRMEFLASLNGWFAPASEILDHLRAGAEPRDRNIPRKRLAKLERKWLFEKLCKGTS